jgi:hypothetical protein
VALEIESTTPGLDHEPRHGPPAQNEARADERAEDDRRHPEHPGHGADPAPVFIGDSVTAEATVIDARADKPITRLRCVARRADGTEILRGECLVYTMLLDMP